MKPIERNPTFTNPLAHSSSLYLQQHAHNPVFWYPWGKEAIERARAENKPIFLSIGYSTCYWCHVMEREVFENLSIASLMNRCCINIKVDREEHPQIDDIYMVARQLLTREGGWPNNLFLTPQLKPFYAGGTYAADESYGKPGFPRLLEWLNYVWTSQEDEARSVADKIAVDMLPHLIYRKPENVPVVSVEQQSKELYSQLQKYHDERGGGFFQAPKFPHECYLQFALGYYEMSGEVGALDMVTRSLEKMAAGGIYDQVGCGFHRYAVDKEWYVPHFEKMLYTQSQLARLYTDAARISGNAFFADIARGILEFVSGPMTAGQGGFYAAIDAETDGVEGAYYAWSAAEFNELLTPQEVTFLTMFYALADIPAFPGHKHVDGQVLIARKPLDQAAREHNMTYLELAAMSGQLMNKLLQVRNKRVSPRIDEKIIVSWNGLMIDAFAHAGKVFNRPGYTARAREAADFILEHVIDNNGNLKRMYAGGRAQTDATLEDYAFLARGLLTLWRVTPDKNLLESAQSLCSRVDELFADAAAPGYFYTQVSDDMLVRIKSGDDSAVPNANAMMLHNLLDLFEITKEQAYHDKAQALAGFFLQGNTHPLMEFATMMQAALRLETLAGHKPKQVIPDRFDAASYTSEGQASPKDALIASASLFPANAAPGSTCEIIITLEIKDGWHVNASRVNQSFLIPTQVDVQGKEIEVVGITYPEPLRKPGTQEDETLLVYEGLNTITVRIRLPRGGKRPPLKIMLRFQPCHGTTCHAVRDESIPV